MGMHDIRRMGTQVAPQTPQPTRVQRVSSAQAGGGNPFRSQLIDQCTFPREQIGHLVNNAFWASKPGVEYQKAFCPPRAKTLDEPKDSRRFLTVLADGKRSGPRVDHGEKYGAGGNPWGVTHTAQVAVPSAAAEWVRRKRQGNAL